MLLPSVSQMNLSKNLIKRTFNLPHSHSILKETVLKRNTKSILPIIDEEEEKDLIAAAALSFKAPQPLNSKEKKSKSSPPEISDS